MRLTLFLLAGIVAGQPLYADVTQVPLLADGTVNTEEVLSAFKLTFPIFENGAQSTDFTGELLGEPFTGEVTGVNAILEFTLSIEAPKLSEHGNFLIATLVTDVFCARNGLRPGLVLWGDTSRHNSPHWEVSSSCAAEIG